MQKTIKINRVIMLVISIIISFSVALAVNTATSVQAYATSLAKPVVTLSNSSSTSVKVSWKKVTSAKKYKVLCSTKKSSGYKTVSTTTSTSYTYKNLTCGKTYYFKVKAVNSKNTATSKVYSIKVKPKKVSSLKTSASCNYIKVSWAKSSGATGYQVYSSTSKSGTYKKLKTVKSTSYKNTSLSLGKTKYYKVRAYKTVNGKKVYGAFSSIVNATTAHTPSSSWFITTQPTCAKTGKKTNVCSNCNKKYSVTIPKDTSTGHNYSSKTISVKATKTTCSYSYTKYTCSNCGKTKTSEIKKKTHSFTSKVTAPTLGVNGYTTYTCSKCGYSYKTDYVDALTADEVTTCTIDLTNQTITNADCAEYNEAKTKLTLFGNNKTDFVITGEAENLTIDVDASSNCEVKLSGVTITNDGRDCFDIKDKSTSEDEVPEVSISVAIDTQNYLTTTTSGNAVESSCPLTIKGHGTLTANTAGTTIACEARVIIKNTTLKITSSNRGIDTAQNLVDENGTTVVDANGKTQRIYYNVKIDANANITIKSVDDCIRCKNFEILEISADSDDVPSTLNLTSTTADGIQVEGSTGVVMNNGNVTISAKKYVFNCKATKITISDTVDIKTTGTYCKA